MFNLNLCFLDAFFIFFCLTRNLKNILKHSPLDVCTESHSLIDEMTYVTSKAKMKHINANDIYKCDWAPFKARGVDQNDYVYNTDDFWTSPTIHANLTMNVILNDLII